MIILFIINCVINKSLNCKFWSSIFLTVVTISFGSFCLLFLFHFFELHSLKRYLILRREFFLNELLKFVLNITLNLNALTILFIISDINSAWELLAHQFCNIFQGDSIMLQTCDRTNHLFTTTFDFVNFDICITWRCKGDLLLLFLLLLSIILSTWPFRCLSWFSIYLFV
jgi:hypothetical protein